MNLGEHATTDQTDSACYRGGFSAKWTPHVVREDPKLGARDFHFWTRALEFTVWRSQQQHRLKNVGTLNGEWSSYIRNTWP